MILSRRRFAEKIDKSVFPGCQGTSAVNTIAAKAVIFKLAGTPGFIRTQAMTLKNAAHLAVALQKRDFRIVTRGTDTHQVLVDVTPRGLDGRTAEQALESAGIVLNQNVIPGDENRKGAVSGIRLGTAGVSARGMGTKEVEMIAEWMARVMVDHRDSRVLEEIRREVASLCSQFSVYGKNGRL